MRRELSQLFWHRGLADIGKMLQFAVICRLPVAVISHRSEPRHCRTLAAGKPLPIRQRPNRSPRALQNPPQAQVVTCRSAFPQVVLRRHLLVFRLFSTRQGQRLYSGPVEASFPRVDRWSNLQCHGLPKSESHWLVWLYCACFSCRRGFERNHPADPTARFSSTTKSRLTRRTSITRRPTERATQRASRLSNQPLSRPRSSAQSPVTRLFCAAGRIELET